MSAEQTLLERGEDITDERRFSQKEWPDELYRVLKSFDVQHVSYVPDAGHSRLIKLFAADPKVTSILLSTEEEGIAVSAGNWLGGKRGVLLLQSSGVGNCINMLSLATIARFPLLMLVAMRGEWAEFNPWQVPMGSAVESSLASMGVRSMRAHDEEDLSEVVRAAATLVYEADQQIAVIISQRIIGRKTW